MRLRRAGCSAYDAYIDMKSFAPRFAVFLLPVILVLAAPQSRAEMWCGNGPGTALSHPCTDADDDDSTAVDDAIAKYQDRWMRLKGVWSVDEDDNGYHDRVPNIEVHVESAFVATVRKQIPLSVDGIPVVIVPGEKPEEKEDTSGFVVGRFSNHSAENAGRANEAVEDARRARREEDRKKAEDLYVSVVQKYGYHWMDLPGVLGMVPKSDGDNGADFRTVNVMVQRELLPEVRKEIPSSVNGVRIVLVPED